MVAERASSVVALSDTASCGRGVMRASFSSPETSPAVLTVMRQGESPDPSGWQSTVIARWTWARLWSGSPMPMKTRLILSPTGGPKFLISTSTWPTISPAVRLRTIPIAPVAQKVQPSAHPTWLEMQ